MHVDFPVVHFRRISCKNIYCSTQRLKYTAQTNSQLLLYPAVCASLAHQQRSAPTRRGGGGGLHYATVAHPHERAFVRRCRRCCWLCSCTIRPASKTERERVGVDMRCGSVRLCVWSASAPGSLHCVFGPPTLPPKALGAGAKRRVPHFTLHDDTEATQHASCG